MRKRTRFGTATAAARARTGGMLPSCRCLIEPSQRCFRSGTLSKGSERSEGLTFLLLPASQTACRLYRPSTLRQRMLAAQIRSAVGGWSLDGITSIGFRLTVPNVAYRAVSTLPDSDAGGQNGYSADGRQTLNDEYHHTLMRCDATTGTINFSKNKTSPTDSNACYSLYNSTDSVLI